LKEALRFNSAPWWMFLGRDQGGLERLRSHEEPFPCLTFYAVSFEGVRKDGSEFWAHVIIDPDNPGSLIGFAKITRGLTERRLADEQLRRSEQHFRLLVQPGGKLAKRQRLAAA
jgi:PAS domain-containing protein